MILGTIAASSGAVPDFINGVKGHPLVLSRKKADADRKAIRSIESSKENPALIRIQ